MDQSPQNTRQVSGIFGVISREEQVALLAIWALIVAGCGWYFISAHGVRKLVDIDHAARIEMTWQVDLNDATQAQLMAIPGIGKKISAAIIEDRESNGPFLEIEELCRVRGIGRPLLEKARPFLVVTTDRIENSTVQHRVKDGQQF